MFLLLVISATKELERAEADQAQNLALIFSENSCTVRTLLNIKKPLSKQLKFLKTTKSIFTIQETSRSINSRNIAIVNSRLNQMNLFPNFTNIFLRKSKTLKYSWLVAQTMCAKVFTSLISMTIFCIQTLKLTLSLNSRYRLRTGTNKATYFLILLTMKVTNLI